MTNWSHSGTPDGAWIDPPPGMMYAPEPPRSRTPAPPAPPARNQVLYHAESDCYFVGDPERLGDDGWGVSSIDPSTLVVGSRIAVGLGHSEVLPSFDFETYSAAGYKICPVTGTVSGVAADGKGGLKVVGTPAYAEHPSTEILSLYYDLKDGRGRRHWVPGMPDPLDLLDHIRHGGLIEAWNLAFEFWIWNIVAVRRLGWPPLPLPQCRCAMAKARRFSLPGSLDAAAAVLGTPGKDKDGKRLLEKLTRPHTPTSKRRATRWTPATAWPDFLKLYSYNGDDVAAEDNAAAHIPDLTPYEFAAWQVDQTINARGVQVDIDALEGALSILGQAERKYVRELAEITEGYVGSVSEVAKFREWLSAKGVRAADLKKDTVAALLKGDAVPPVCRRALELREKLGSANVKKLRKLNLQVNSDGRLRNQYMYCGADRTGRWSSAAAEDGASNSQLQNITAKGPKTSRCEGCNKIFGRDVAAIGCPRCGSWLFHELPEWTIEAVEQAVEDIKPASLEYVERIWGDAIAVLCGCLRGMFIAAPGKKLICCDFSAIEAVAAACLSRCQWRIDVFSTHGMIYEQSAANATGLPFDEIVGYKKLHGSHHPARKGVGKIRELAGGYGGWVTAWKNFGADDYFVDDAAIKADVLKWRDESPEIVEMWGGQFRWCGPGKWDYKPELFGLEGCAILAIQNPGKCYTHYDVTYGVKDDVLYCRLPSGRYLNYHRPRLIAAVDKLNRGPCWSISFEGYNSNSQKGPVGWGRWETFGGRLFENVVQAVSCDIQAEALIRLESRGYPVVMHTHDEGCAEVPEGFGSVKEMCAIMSERPAWASWWPLKAAGWEHKRYQKD